MDTKFYLEALREFLECNPDKGNLQFHQLTVADMCNILARAQALKLLMQNNPIR
jgi:hypothetical protein